MTTETTARRAASTTPACTATWCGVQRAGIRPMPSPAAGRECGQRTSAFCTRGRSRAVMCSTPHITCRRAACSVASTSQHIQHSRIASCGHQCKHQALAAESLVVQSSHRMLSKPSLLLRNARACRVSSNAPCTLRTTLQRTHPCAVSLSCPATRAFRPPSSTRRWPYALACCCRSTSCWRAISKSSLQRGSTCTA